MHGSSTLFKGHATRIILIKEAWATAVKVKSGKFDLKSPPPLSLNRWGHFSKIKIKMSLPEGDLCRTGKRRSLLTSRWPLLGRSKLRARSIMARERLRERPRRPAPSPAAAPSSRSSVPSAIRGIQWKGWLLLATSVGGGGGLKLPCVAARATGAAGVSGRDGGSAGQSTTRPTPVTSSVSWF